MLFFYDITTKIASQDPLLDVKQNPQLVPLIERKTPIFIQWAGAVPVPEAWKDRKEAEQLGSSVERGEWCCPWVGLGERVTLTTDHRPQGRHE